MVHGIEEYITGFYAFDLLLFSHLGTISKMSYVASQVGLISLALFIYFFILKKKIGFIVSILWGFLLLFELEHVYRAMSLGTYTPGLLTSFLLVIFGFIYWKELIKNWKKPAKIAKKY